MHQIPDLDKKGLREFALVTSGVIVGLFGLLLPWLFKLGWPTWPWVLAAILVTLGFVAPMVLRPVYRALDAIRIGPQQDHHPDHHGVGVFSSDYPNRIDPRLVFKRPFGQKFS